MRRERYGIKNGCVITNYKKTKHDMNKSEILEIYDFCINGNETDFEVIKKIVSDYLKREEEMVATAEYGNQF